MGHHLVLSMQLMHTDLPAYLGVSNTPGMSSKRSSGGNFDTESSGYQKPTDLRLDKNSTSSNNNNNNKNDKQNSLADFKSFDLYGGLEKFSGGGFDQFLFNQNAAAAAAAALGFPNDFLRASTSHVATKYHQINDFDFHRHLDFELELLKNKHLLQSKPCDQQQSISTNNNGETVKRRGSDAHRRSSSESSCAVPLKPTDLFNGFKQHQQQQDVSSLLQVQQQNVHLNRQIGQLNVSHF